MKIDQSSKLSKSLNLFIIKQKITFAFSFLRTGSVDTWWRHKVESGWKLIENLESLNSIWKERKQVIPGLDSE